MADDSVSNEQESPDPYFEPLVNLPHVEVKTLEEDEEELFKMRARLFRFDKESDPPEWKERGIGHMKILQHHDTKVFRILMRREVTHKICANHCILPGMELKKLNNSEKTWFWFCHGDVSDDDEPCSELLAIRFAKPDHAQEFQKQFDEAVESMTKRKECEEQQAENTDLNKTFQDLAIQSPKREEEGEEEGRESKKEEDDSSDDGVEASSTQEGREGRSEGVEEEKKKEKVAGNVLGGVPS